MAYIYPDYMPTYNFLTDEEERRRREEEAAAAATPVTQTIKTNPVTGEQEMTIKGTPQDLSAANPLTPTVLGPAVPEQTIAQPMAMPQPGPGVQVASIGPGLPQTQPAAPAQQIPTVDQLAEQERQKRLAAQVTQPAMPVAPDQSAAETQRLLAQNAQAAPVAPEVAPLPQPGPGVQVAGPAQMPPSAAPAPAAPSFDSRFTQAAGDASSLLALSKDESLTAEQKKLAARQAHQVLTNELGLSRAKDEVAKMSDLDMSRVLRSKSEEGSWAKMILLGFISPDLAGKEAAKLGLNDKWVTGTNEQGNPILYKTRDGVPIEGYDAANDRRLSAKELIGAAGTQLGKQVTTTAETYVDEAGNRYRSQTDERGNSRLVNIATGARFTGDATKLKRQTDISQMARVDYNLAADLLKKHSGNVLDMMKEYELIKGPLSDEGRGQFLRTYGYGTTIPAPTTPGQAAPAPAPTAPGQAAPAPAPTAPTAPAQRPAQRPAVPTTATAQRPAGAGVSAGTGGVAGGGLNTSIGSMRVQQGLGQTAGEANIKLAAEERSNFLTYEEKDIVPKADAGGSISQIRKSQIKGPDGILNNPEIVGMLSGQGGATAEVGNIIRDLVTGARTDEELSQRIASLGLTQRQKDVLYNQIALNRQVAPYTLKQNAGAGAVSDAEQRANRQANVDITRVPLYTAVTILSKDQFDKDLSVARQAFRNANPNLTTVRSFNDAWGKEKSRLDREYNQIYEERAKYIAKYYQDGKNPGAIVDAYKYYPVPEFDRQTGGWNYGTDYARKAARPRLNSFER